MQHFSAYIFPPYIPFQWRRDTNLFDTKGGLNVKKTLMITNSNHTYFAKALGREEEVLLVRFCLPAVLRRVLKNPGGTG
jgi:hypothetical protein